MEVIKQHEFDPTGNVAKPLANARGHHQKSLADRDKAEKIVEVPNRLVTRLETISNEFGKEVRKPKAGSACPNDTRMAASPGRIWSAPRSIVFLMTSRKV